MPWLARPGLAGGIDKDGSRSAELLALGFGSVEFGTVTARPLSGHNAGTLRLAGSLAEISSAARRTTAIGVGLGLPPGLPADDIAAEWSMALGLVWGVADYASFNLSAAASRRFLQPEYRKLLAAVFRQLVSLAEQLAETTGRRVPLALKIPLGGEGEPLPDAAKVAAAAGFDQLTMVLPGDGQGFGRLQALGDALDDRPVLVAVGGIRSGADIAAARGAGASGIQVHRLFVEQGAACLKLLG